MALVCGIMMVAMRAVQTVNQMIQSECHVVCMLALLAYDDVVLLR